MATKKRVVIYLDPAECAALRKIMEKTGASRAELCRRAIIEWLKKQHQP